MRCRSISRRCGLALCTLCACGPGVDDAPEHYEPRLCGQEGPVQVLALDEPARNAVVRLVGERWMMLRFSFIDTGGAHSVDFAVDTVEPCGGDRVSLPPRLWPIVVGDALMGCDVLEGALYLVDPHTGEQGAKVAEGLQCDPLKNNGDRVLMRELSTGTIAVLEETGDVAFTSIPFAIEEGENDADEPYLVDPFSVLVGQSGSPSRIRGAGDAGVLVLADDRRLWQFEPGSSSPRQLAEGVDAFVANDQVVAIRAVEHADAEAYAAQLLDLRTGVAREGPTVSGLLLHGPYLDLGEGLFDLGENAAFALPPGTHVSGVWPVTSPLAYDASQGVQVWEVETGAVVLDHRMFPLVSGHLQLWGDVVTANYHGACEGDEVWSYPLDGSEPRRMRKAPAGMGIRVRSRDELLMYPACSAGEVTYENLRTGQSWVISTDVAADVFPSVDVVGSPVFEGREPLFYYVEDEERTGIWVTVLPKGEK